MSSRNRYLSSADRRAAPILYRALLAGRQTIEEGRVTTSAVEDIMRKTVEQEPSARVEYLALCDPVTLEPLERIDRRALLLGAIKIGSIRLIDNVL